MAKKLATPRVATLLIYNSGTFGIALHRTVSFGNVSRFYFFLFAKSRERSLLILVKCELWKRPCVTRIS